MNTLNTLFPEAAGMMRFIVAVVLLVLTAVGVDLVFGLWKAGIRGEVRSSWGLKRTSIKVLLYVGVILVMGFVDYLIHICRFYKIFGWEDLIGLPLLTAIIGIFFLIIEIKSMFESADEKTKTEIMRSGQMIGQILNKEEIAEVISKSIIKAMKKQGKLEDAV